MLGACQHHAYVPGVEQDALLSICDGVAAAAAVLGRLRGAGKGPGLLGMLIS